MNFLGQQGIEISTDNVYARNIVFSENLSVGYALSTPINSTIYPNGVAAQISGGDINLCGDLNVKNQSDINLENGSLYINGSISGSQMVISGTALNLFRLCDLPDHTETGNIPEPASGVVFRSGHHLMII